jgi:hypothetical protein
MDKLEISEEFRLALVKACVDAAKMMGQDLKKMSWFGRNHLRSVEGQGSVESQAA